MPPTAGSNAKRRRAVRTVLRYLGRYRRGLAIGAVCLVLNDAFLLVRPWVLKLAVDDLGRGVVRSRLGLYAMLIVGVAAASGVFRFLMRRIIIGISRRIEVDMRADFFGHLQRLSPSFFDARRTGDIMALATNDLNAVRTLVGPAVMYSMNTIVVGGFSIALMLRLSWLLTLAALTPMAVLIVVVYRNMRIIHRLFERVQERFAAINSRAQENLAGIRVVKAYAREDHEVDTFRRLSEDYVHENLRLLRVQALLNPTLTALAAFGALAILLVGGRLVIDGVITLGVFVAFNGYLMMLIWPAIAIGWVMNIVERGLASMQRINAVLDVEPDIVDPPADEAVDSSTLPDRTIRFENVTFAYPGAGRERGALRDLDLEVRHGETLAVVGPTGSGKSTLVALLLRLYDPQAGRVTIGGVDVRRLELADLRRLIGVVPQDIFLFSETIRENIAFGVERLDDPALRAVAETASIHDEIERFPAGYESRIGERGINLSGGQKQRVAIARALARDPDILVLDDALSSVDATTEERILASLENALRRRTAIIVTHRVTTLHGVDRIAVLDDGRLADVGTHEELVGRCAVYADMVEKQTILFDLERR